MTVYFGFPVSYQEAFRILKQSLEPKDIHHACDILNILNKYLYEKNVEIRLFTTDKYQFIIGYEIPEIGDIWHKFVYVYEFINLLGQLREKFSIEMKLLDADISEIRIEYMEGDNDQPSNIIKNPIPYIISYY